jgi:hypothetical protein
MKAKRPPPPSLPEMKKGTLLMVKAPPYYEKEYLYEVLSAGDKLIRAGLYHSPTVRKNWSKDELLALFNNGIVRLAKDDEIRASSTLSAHPPQESED